MIRLSVVVVVFVTTLAMSSVGDGFYISWYPAYAPAKTVLTQRPSYHYKPYSPYKVKARKTPNSYYTGSIMPEDNQLCSKFKCDQKTCCSGECVNVFGMQICIVVSNQHRYGRR